MPRAPFLQRGLSLVEIMIAIALGLIIVAALSVLFVDTSRANREMAKANAMIENGRFAIQVLEGEAVHAGYWGEFVPRYDDLLTDSPAAADVPTLVPDPCLSYGSWTAAHKTNLISIAAQPDYETTTWASDTSTVAAACTGVIADAQANSDVIVIRHAENCFAGEGNCDAVVDGKVYFQTSRCEDGTESGKYVLDGTAGSFTLKKYDCATAAVKRRFVSDIYYVRSWARQAGDGTPTLVRVRFDGTTPAYQSAEPLVEGIESLRIEYGIDAKSKTGEDVVYWTAPVTTAAPIAWSDNLNKMTPRNRGDGVPESFVRCTTASHCTAFQLANVTALKIYVLSRGREPTPGWSDTRTYSLGSAPTICSIDGSCTLKTLDPTFKRQMFSTTVRLANVVQRRETP